MNFRKPFLLIFAALVAVFAFAPPDLDRSHTSHQVVPTEARDGFGEIVIDLVDNYNDNDLQHVSESLGSYQTEEFRLVHPEVVEEGIFTVKVNDVSAALMALDNCYAVEAVDPNALWHQLTLPAEPDDPMFDKQWHMQAMGAPTGWSTSPAGEGAVVAVIDDGLAKVEDLAETEVLTGKSFVPSEPYVSTGGTHGTHVAGTIAQSTNNGLGLTGVAPKATILPVKVLSSSGSGRYSWIAAGIDYATDQGVDVINMSLGGTHNSGVVHNAVKKARQAGIVVVAARGNSASSAPLYPGSYEETIGVSATGPDGTLATYSSYGQGTDIAAPGGDKSKGGEEAGVWQNTVDYDGTDVYASYNGTSMASPHVAGAAAVLFSTGQCKADCVERTLLTSADGDGEWDEQFGYGRLDLATALGKADNKFGAIRFGLGALFALAIGLLASSSRKFTAQAVALGAISAGGLFFVNDFLPNHLITTLVSSGWLFWPGLLLDPSYSSWFIWCSAIPALGLTYIFGPFHKARPIVAGLLCGLAATLLHGSVADTLQPFSWGWLSSFWLVGNGLAALLMAISVAGVENLENQQNADLHTD